MTNHCCKLIEALRGRTVAVAESCTGGGIGAALTSVPGSSKIFRGGVIAYTNWVKENVLGVDRTVLSNEGAVCATVAEQMAIGVRKCMRSSMAVSVTGVAGPDSDSFQTPIGTVYIGYCDATKSYARKYAFQGDREQVRQSAVQAAIELLLNECI